MFLYPIYPYLDFALIALASGIAFAVFGGVVGYALRPKENE